MRSDVTKYCALHKVLDMRMSRDVAAQAQALAERPRRFKSISLIPESDTRTNGMMGKFQVYA